MNEYLTAIVAILGGGGLVGVISLFVVPANRKYDSVQNEIAELRKEVETQRNELKDLRQLVRFLTSGVTALTMHSDSLRDAILRHDPQARIETAGEVLARVQKNIALTDGETHEPK